MMMQFSEPHTVSEYGFGEAAQEIQRRARDAQRGLAQTRVFSEIARVRNRDDDWDGCGSARPIEAACSRAFAEIATFMDVALAEALDWQHPHVGSNEIGEISFEWWRNEKKFTVYVGPAEMRYVCSWGVDINNTMDAGVLPSDGFLQKWRWFRT